MIPLSTGGDESLPRRAWESRPDTAPPTPPMRPSLHCETLCGMASNNLVALCHPLPYDRRATPSKKDSGALEVKADDYATPAQGQRHDVGPAGPVTFVAIGPVRPSPSSPNTIPVTASPSPTLWERVVTGRRHAGHCASYDLMSTAPSSPHTGDPYVATLKAAPRHAQDAPRRPARSKILQDGRLFHDAVHRASTRR
jgi:hypothetical protein